MIPSYYNVEIPCNACVINGEACLADGELGLISIPSTSDTLANLPSGDTVPFYSEAISSSTGEVVDYTGQPSCTPAPAPPPPPAPTAETVFKTAPLPAPEIELNPNTFGVTQLPTWFALGNDASGTDVTVAIPGGVNGYSVSLTAHPVDYYWDFGDGNSDVSSTSGEPGAATAASATHTYLEPGTYSVGVSVSWAGTYTFSGYGITETESLGPVVEPVTVHTYVVQQIGSVLLPSADG